MTKTILLFTLVALLALQFTGGIGSATRALPRALCWGLVPDFNSGPELCAQSGGILIRFLRDAVVPVLAPPDPPPTDDSITLYPDPRNGFKAEWGVVFPAGRAELLTRQCSRAVPGKPEGTWDPSPAQINRLEMSLTNFIDIFFRRHFIDRAGARALVPENYYRQYGGVTLGGRRFIYVNGFHRSHIELQQDLKKDMPDWPIVNWQSDPVMVCDGGPSYFGALFNPDANLLVDVEFNGR